MGYLILIVAVIVVLVLIFKKKRPSEEELSGLIKEVNNIIDDFLNLQRNGYLSNHIGDMMIIPVDAKGDLYFNSDRINISILCLDDDELNLQSYQYIIDNNDTRFRLVNWENSWNFACTTIACFNGEYKKVMPVIYKVVKAKYPELNWEFDGSRIILRG